MNLETNNRKNSNVIDFEAYLRSKKITLLINKLIRMLDIKSEEICDILSISNNELLNIQHGKKELDAFQLLILAKHYNFPLEAFWSDTIDFNILRNRKYNDQNIVMPERYTIGAFSKKNNILPTLNYIERNYGWELKEDALEYLQIDKVFFQDIDAPVSLYLLTDLLDYLKRRGLKDQEIFNIGLESASTKENLILKQLLGKAKSPRELYEIYTHQVVHKVERNNLYRIVRLTNDYLIIDFLENPELLEILKTKHSGTPLRCINRQGLASVATKFLGVPPTQVTEIKCVHRGDPFCRMYLDFSGPNYHLKQKIKSQFSIIGA